MLEPSDENMLETAALLWKATNDHMASSVSPSVEVVIGDTNG